ASALTRRADCGTYTIISTRGTGEIQGPSIAFANMIRQTLANVTGGVEYDTQYAADISQLSEAGTQDVVNKINTSLQQCPGHKFALLGYSQGATVTTEALTRIPNNSDAFKAVVAVVTVGNPRHNKNLQSNFDTDGGKSTAQGFGLLSYLPPIPDYWDKSGKVLDVCAHGDGVCDVTSGIGVGPAHFLYTTSQFTQ
ncbi:alpha/beta-hydrolase, partial [Ceraceosorus guamensis]